MVLACVYTSNHCRCLKSQGRCVYISKNRGKPHAQPRILRDIQPATVEEPDVLPDLFDHANGPAEEELSFEGLHRNMLEKLFPQVLGPTKKTSPKVDTTPKIVKNIRLTPSQAKTCFEKFEAVNIYTPFVPLPENWTTDDMLRKHPVFSLGIIASMAQHDLRGTLDERFRQLLGDRVIVKSRIDLDTLQGLLVFLAWCPLHINLRRGSLYQTVQMLGALVRDLRLDTNATSKAEQRAYLGACYLSSCVAMPPRRQNALPFSEPARTALLYLASNPESEMDKMLVSMVTIQQTIQDSQSVPVLDDSLLQSFVSQMHLMGCLGFALHGTHTFCNLTCC
jgi:hypothetical protein